MDKGKAEALAPFPKGEGRFGRPLGHIPKGTDRASGTRTANSSEIPNSSIRAAIRRKPEPTPFPELRDCTPHTLCAVRGVTGPGERHRACDGYGGEGEG